jgi:hypothetical protein
MRTICFAIAALATACSSWAERGQADLRGWLPELPPESILSARGRAQHVRKWLPEVQPGMSVATVIVMLGVPDWGVNTHGKLQWWLNPKKGVLRYSMTDRGSWKGGESVVEIYFDPNARVKTIRENGQIIAEAPPKSWNIHVPRGLIWWR